MTQYRIISARQTARGKLAIQYLDKDGSVTNTIVNRQDVYIGPANAYQRFDKTEKAYLTPDIYNDLLS